MNREVISLAIPSIISNITVPLLGLVDLTIVGHIGDAAYISAIATGSMIFNIIYWLLGFLRMGTSGMTAQAYGRQSGAEAAQTLRTSVSAGAGVGILFVVCQWFILRFMLWAMNTPPESMELVAQYFDIVIWGAPAMLSLYAMTGWFVGMQDTRMPMVISIVQNIVNIIASLVFVFVVGWKIEGVATGTLIAQWSGVVMALAGVRYKKRHERLFELSDSGSSETAAPALADGKEAVAPTFSILHFFKVNRDIFLRTVCLVAVNMFFTSAGGKQGAMILAVNALLITLYTLFSYFMDGFAYAAEALCGRYYGAGDKTNFRAVLRRLYLWGLIMVVVFTLLYAVGGRPFLGLLTSDRQVVDVAMDFFPWALAIPVCGVMAFIYDGVFIGITATKGMLLSSAVSAVLFFSLFFVLQPVMGNNALWLAFLSFLACRGIVQGVLLHSKLRNDCA